MEYQEFVERVEDRITPTQTAAAELAIASTLSTLGERITGEEAEDLAAQLPEEMKGPLHGETGDAEEFSLDEFYERVARREGVSVEEATEHVAAVMGVLRDAVSGGEVEDVISQLPPEFEPLLR